MIDYVIGKVKRVKDLHLTILVNGLGLSFQMPQAQNVKEGDNVELHTYFHWNSDNGPSLFAFKTELERTVFLMIIDCPKIGPKIALTILSQMSTSDFLEIISSQDEKRLSTVNGIGAKKAEQIIMQLKSKVSKLISSGEIKVEENQNFSQWQNLNDVLVSLGYTKQEISGTIKYLGDMKTENLSFDQLLRKSLGFLSKNI